MHGRDPDNRRDQVFHTLATCQDRAHFTNAPATLRFAIPTNYLPASIECIASIASIAFDPAVISLGKDLGQRATLTVTFNDHRHSDTGAGYDKYLADRPYDPYSLGTFWGKFAARQKFVRGRPLRWIVGDTDQALADMQTRHFIIDSITGPSNNGEFKIIAKDLLKLADGDRALAPAVSNGFLVADIDDITTALTLSPVGVGLEYPLHGYIAIGGSEICEYYRDTTNGNDAVAFCLCILTAPRARRRRRRLPITPRSRASRPLSLATRKSTTSKRSFCIPVISTAPATM